MTKHEENAARREERELRDEWTEPAVSETDREIGNGCAVACMTIIAMGAMVFLCAALLSWFFS